MINKIIILYYICTLAYLNIRKIENYKNQKMIFAICIPIFGLIAVIISDTMEKNNKLQKGSEKTRKITKKNKDFLNEIQSSIIDDLAVENYEKAREIMLSIKSLPFNVQCEIYNIAINSKNVEIAHIAAVSIMRIQTYFEKELAKYENKENPEDLQKYIECLNTYIDCNLAYGGLKIIYINNLINEIEKIIEISEKCDTQNYLILIERALEIKNYDKAKRYSEELILKNPLEPKAYIVYLKTCYKMKDYKNFLNCINNLKNNHSLENTKELKKILEFWEGEY